MKLVPIVLGFLVFAVIIYILIPKPTPVKKCPDGYYYAPWASIGTQCIPIGSSSSEAGVSSGAIQSGVLDTPMFPA